jgi:hypothetical protein
MNKDLKLIIITGIYYPVAVLSLWIFWKESMMLTLILFIIAIIELIVTKSRKLIILFLLGCVVGPIVESVAIWRGSWSYSMPEIYNIPLWLIPAWGNVTIFVVTFYKFLGRFGWLEKKAGSE